MFYLIVDFNVNLLSGEQNVVSKINILTPTAMLHP